MRHRRNAHIVNWRTGVALISLGAILVTVRLAPAAIKKSSQEFTIPRATPVVSVSALEKVSGLERAFVEVSKHVGPAVVSVVASYTIVHRFTPWGDDFFDEFFRYFFETPPQYERRQPVVSGGSGFIVTPDGYILTNAHVIGKAKYAQVRLLNKKEYKAKIIGIDEGTDLAVLKIKAPGNLVTAPLGNSDKIQVGQWAIAIGNPFGLENTMTVGVISAKGRQLNRRAPFLRGGKAAQYTSFIQTDASINKGNSGGPLLNIKGEVIGINTIIFSPSGGSVGIGFAIPVNIAKNTMEGLIREGRIIRPQLGVAYRPVAPEVAKKLGLPPGTGMEISDVLPGTAAERAGLKPGDIILSINKKPLKEADDLRSTVLQSKVGGKVNLEIYRKGNRLTIVATLKELETVASKSKRSKRGRSSKGSGEASWLGMTVTELTDELVEKLEARENAGVVVTRVEPDSPAAVAGVRTYDIIREVEQAPIADLAEFETARKRISAPDNVLLLIERGGSTMYLVIEQKARKPE